MRAWGWLGILAVFFVPAYWSVRAGEPEEAAARRARVAELLVKLKDPDSAVRSKAAEALGSFPGEEGVLPALAAMLHDPDRNARSSAAASLSDMGPEAAAAFVVALQDKSPEVREVAALGLCWMKAQAAPAKEALLKALDDDVYGVREYAATALAAIPQAREEFLKAFSDPRPGVRAAITRSVPDSGAQNYSLLAKAVSDPEVGVRLAAVAALSRLVGDADLVTPPLIAALADADKGLRVAAMGAIGRVKQVSAGLLKGVRDLLADPDAGLRAAAADCLAGMGPRAAAAGPDLIKALADANPAVRKAAAFAVGTVCTTQDSAPVLMKALQDPQWEVRAMAVLGLGRPDAGPEAVAAILESLKDQWYDVRLRAAAALGAIGPGNEAATAALVAMAAGGDPDSQVRRSAVDALHKFGGGKGVAQALAKALKDADTHVRVIAASSLARIGPPAREATGALLDAARDEESDVRFSVMLALGAMGAEKGVVPTLVKALRDDVASVRERAGLALERIGGPAAEALPALEKALKDESEAVRKQAASAIGKIRQEQRRSTQPEVF
jgi:HEAT repeat protein